MQFARGAGEKNESGLNRIIGSASKLALPQDTTLSPRTSGIVYVLSGALLLHFSCERAAAAGVAATLLFEDELVDVNWLSCFPVSAVRSISAVTEVVVISERELQNIPFGALQKAGALAARLGRQLMASTAFSQEARLCSLLVKFGARIGQQSHDGLVFDLPVSRDGLAAIAGVRPETMSRTIRKAEEEGLITVFGRRGIRIHDWPVVCNRAPLAKAIIGSIPSWRAPYLERFGHGQGIQNP